MSLVPDFSDPSPFLMAGVKEGGVMVRLSPQGSFLAAARSSSADEMGLMVEAIQIHVDLNTMRKGPSSEQFGSLRIGADGQPYILCDFEGQTKWIGVTSPNPSASEPPASDKDAIFDQWELRTDGAFYQPKVWVRRTLSEVSFPAWDQSSG